MSDHTRNFISDDLLSLVNGGTLPNDWQDSVRNSILVFLKMSDEDLKMWGIQRTCEGLISTMDAQFQKQEGLSDAKMEEVKQFIRNNYASLEASIN